MVYNLDMYSRISISSRCAAGKGTVRSLKRVVELLFLVFGQIRLKSGESAWLEWIPEYLTQQTRVSGVWCARPRLKAAVDAVDVSPE